MLLHRLRAFLLLLGLGALIMVLFIAGVTLASVHRYIQEVISISGAVWQLVETGVTLLLNTGLFCLIYRLLPKVQVHWWEALRGAMLTAVTWELGRLALTSFLVGDKYSAYGVVGSFIAVMLWIYYASTAVFLGAEYIQVICEDCKATSDRVLGSQSSPWGSGRRQTSEMDGGTP
jgi:membrane protein